MTLKLKFILQGSRGQGECWRQSGKSIADHFHIFWGCSFIQSFWQQIAKEIRSVFFFWIEVDCLHYTWVKSQTNSWPHWMNILIKILWLQARKNHHTAVAAGKSIIKDGWPAIVNKMYCMDKFTFSSGLQSEQRLKYWGKWIAYSMACNLPSVLY